MEVDKLRVIAAFACFCTLVKAFDWLRLFDGPAFCIKLVEETLKDIAAFMVVLFVSLMIFGIPLGVLNMNRDASNSLIDTVFGSWVLDVMFNQYLLGLGEFGMDNFSDNPQAIICYIFFISATFITQITMLNMLIAIMGDTFGRIIENIQVNALKTKIELMEDLSKIMNDSDSKMQLDTYLVIA